jgi:hypothetical protein
MPSAQDIHAQLAAIAAALEAIAIVWHIAIVVIAIALIRGWHPGRREALLLVLVPLLSVFVVSARYGNWFNALSFGALAIALASTSHSLPERWRPGQPTWSFVLGVGLVAFGFWYPHFTQGAWYRSFYASPVGLVPCPTLAVVSGFALIRHGFGTRAVPLLLAAWTAFYATFGVARLGVALDVGLYAAMLGLLGVALENGRAAHAPA